MGFWKQIAREDKPPPKKLDADGISPPAKIMFKLQAKATKLKTQFFAVASVAVDIGEAIDKALMWSWAKNTQNGGELTTAIKELRSSDSDFGRGFLTQDV